jgi:hypothetical protein
MAQTEIVFGIPPFPQKKAERMGHGSLQQKQNSLEPAQGAWIFGIPPGG